MVETRYARVLRAGARRTRLAALVAFAVCALGVSACGSSDDNSSSGASTGAAASSTTTGGSDPVQTAKAAVTKASAAPTFTAPGPAFKVASGLTGKKVWYVANGLNFPFSQNLVKGVTDAAKVVGMKVTAVDGAGQPAKAASLIQQGISQKAAAIVIQAFPSKAVMEPIKAAKAAGIPVVQINDGGPGLPSAAARAAGVFANVASCYACGGASLADIVVANSGGKANVVFVDVPDIQTTAGERDAFEKRLAELCESCKVKAVSSPVAQWNGLAALTTSVLKADPTVNYLVPALDAMVAIMKPAIYASNAQDRVHVASYNATKPVMADLKKGVLISGLVGNPEEWIGWGVMDQALRALSNQEPLGDEKIPNRTFVKDNVGDIDVNTPSIEWYGTTDFRGGYTGLWQKP
jgi:ribose transport system substrate-binding protein